MPQSEDEWNNIALEFNRKWNFPNCIGCLDGKQISIKSPRHSGSLYFNYKHFFSVVLLALVDANYKFLYVDIGNYGRTSDGGVYNNSSLSVALAQNTLSVPPPKQLPGLPEVGLIPHVIVADDAFALKSYLMKPYSQRGLTSEQRIFNYRLSRARRTVESAFGILSQRFRVFCQPIALEPEKVQTVTHAACCLHNFLMRDQASATVYVPEDIATDTHTVNAQVFNNNHMQHLAQQGSNRTSFDAQEVRNKLCAYFNSEQGSVPWQNDRVNKL